MEKEVFQYTVLRHNYLLNILKDIKKNLPVRLLQKLA